MIIINAIPNNRAGLTLFVKSTGMGWLATLGLLIISLMAIAPAADAGCSCSGGTWDPSYFLNSEPGAVQTSAAQGSATGNSGSGAQKPFDRLASYTNGELLKPMKSVSSSDVVLDASNGDGYSASHIKNAVHIPSRDFLNGDGNLKMDEELARVLGDAGISREDSIVIYGSNESSGEAEFAFWVLRYMGQKDVKVLDGNLADWQAAGLPVEASENKKPALEYKPVIDYRTVANYEYVKSGQAQIIDVRPFVEFGKGRIPGSIALDPANVIKGDRIKNGGDLSMVFSRLDKDKPIVVYSDDYSRSALAFYALQLMGYRTSIYTWEDWLAQEAAVGQAGAAAVAGDAAGPKYTRLGRT